MHVLDVLLGLTARGPRFFCDGWGDEQVIAGTSLAALVGGGLAPARVHVGRAHRAAGGWLREGEFVSPEERLRAGSRRARIRLLLPAGKVRGVVLHLAASGDQGFNARLRFAAPLLSSGIGAVVLENALYGSRRPARQIGPAVRSVADLHLMGAATLLEGRALLAWLREAEGYEHVGVTGFSMGGQMAAMVGASLRFPLAVVPLAPTCSPDAVLERGVLRDLANWRALAREGESREAARVALCSRLSHFSVRALPPPACPRAAMVVGAAADGVVPPDEARKIAEHWGCELRWLSAGHVSAVLRHQRRMRQALADAFARLESAPRRLEAEARSAPMGAARGDSPPASAPSNGR